MLSEEIGVKEVQSRKIMTKKLTIDNGNMNEDLQEAINQDTS